MVETNWDTFELVKTMRMRCARKELKHLRVMGGDRLKGIGGY